MSAASVVEGVILPIAAGEAVGEEEEQWGVERCWEVGEAWHLWGLRGPSQTGCDVVRFAKSRQTHQLQRRR